MNINWCKARVAMPVVSLWVSMLIGDPCNSNLKSQLQGQPFLSSLSNFGAMSLGTGLSWLTNKQNGFGGFPVDFSRARGPQRRHGKDRTISMGPRHSGPHRQTGHYQFNPPVGFVVVITVVAVVVGGGGGGCVSGGGWLLLVVLLPLLLLPRHLPACR